MLRFFLFLFLLAYTFAYTGAALADGPKSVALATGEFPPHISEDLPGKGSFSEIVVKAFENVGYTVELNFLPWKRAYKLAKEAHVDGTYSWAATEERKKDFVFSDPIFTLEHRLFVMRNSSIYVQNAEELTGLRLCRALGYAVHGVLRDMHEKNQISLVRPRDMETCFKFMQEGRVDFIELSYEEGITNASKAMGTLDLVRTLDYIPNKVANTLAIPLIHPQKETLLHDFNRGLAQLHETGAFVEIMDRHHQHFLDSLTTPNNS